jgi:hypothetical protein
MIASGPLRVRKVTSTCMTAASMEKTNRQDGAHQ